MSFAAILTLSAPLVLAALAELLGQRSGVLNIGIEGVLLVGCLAAALAAPLVGPWWAIAVAAVVGAATNGAFAVAVILGADQVVAGTGMVLAGMGSTGMVFRHLQSRGHGGELLPMLPWGPLEMAAVLLVPLLAWLLMCTHTGLVVRACGENPDAVAAAGRSPHTIRFAVLVAAGGLIGVAGAALVLRASGAFVEGMSAGRGFLALAIVLLGRWRPLWIAVGAVLLGAATALQFHLQGLGTVGVPYHLLLALPYVITLVVLAVVPPDRMGGPAALGKAYRAQR
jgi:simple sugar transport system permease protein